MARTGIVAAFAAVVAVAARAADPPPLSAAQVALFDTNHLGNVTRPEVLEYTFVREGDGGFTDRVLERIERIHPDGSKYAGFDYLSGARHLDYPAVDDFNGNPLIMLFLESDVREMRDHIGMPAAYFRNRIRAAFLDKAEVADTNVNVGGTNEKARRITLRPFADDPRLAGLPPIRDKTYTFVIAEAVPGMIVELSAETPADVADGVPPLGVRLTFAAAKPEEANP
jgi:hypothetical protein